MPMSEPTQTPEQIEKETIQDADVFPGGILSTEPKSNKQMTLKELIDFIRDVAVILAIVLFVRAYIVSPFQINGSSMETSYHTNEYILVNKFSYAMIGDWKVSDPVRGDVAIIKPHAANGKEYYIKRVIGLPGDTVKFQDGEVYLKTKTASEFVKLNEDYLSPDNKGKTYLPLDINETEFTVPEDEYFLMGDNRGGSADSRSCFLSCSIPNSTHFIKRSDMSGKVLISFGYFNLFKD